MDNPEPKLPRYERLPETENGKLFHWCVVHRRPATHLLLRKGIEPTPCCDPDAGGIMMPCQTFPAIARKVKK